MRLEDILFREGFGARRVCAGLVQHGLVEVDATGSGHFVVVDDTGADFPQDDGLRLRVQGQPWTAQAHAYVMLHKPAGFECSHKPSAWPSVYTLLPAPLRQRPVRGSAVAGVQAVGRLDQDTTGLLLLSDNGAFIHRMASPRHHVPKTYVVTTARAITSAMVEQLLAGVVLADDPRAVRAVRCEVQPDNAHVLHLTLTQGKYHQVKRMLAAVGNHVTALHRSHIGTLALPDDLPSGQWRWLTADDLRAITVAV